MGKESGLSSREESVRILGGEPWFGNTAKTGPPALTGDGLGASFEDLITDLSARLVRLSASEIDGAIEEAQALLCGNLGLDRSCFFERLDESSEEWLLTHVYQRGCNPVSTKRIENREQPQPDSGNSWDLANPSSISASARTNVRILFPWVCQQLNLGKPVAFSCPEELPAEAVFEKETFRRDHTQSLAAIPMRIGGTLLGCLMFATLDHPIQWSEQLLRRLHLVADVFAHTLARRNAERSLREKEERISHANLKIEELKRRLQAESEYLKEEFKVRQKHHNIIGRSAGILRALHLVEQVAPTASAVLLTGETGTGKELLARSIHQLSPRQDRLMVEVNCAALPDALVESELFGRERGAYTGALTSRVGRFEVADGSTIFLDEVGELSLEVQAKLLRVLQSGQFQRLGDSKDHKVNARVIAATNRDLAQAVRQGRFREDLYYRLNVFPIHVPPLRERPEDIPLLVMAFIQEFATRMGKNVPKVPCRVMEALQRHRWPGNIRELRNVIERGIILSSGSALQLTFMRELEPLGGEVTTLAEAEQQQILKTLEKTGWRIKGPHGAAHLLGLKPSTLYSRMKKLGIPHRREKCEVESPSERLRI